MAELAWFLILIAAISAPAVVLAWGIQLFQRGKGKRVPFSRASTIAGGIVALLVLLALGLLLWKVDRDISQTVDALEALDFTPH